MPDQLLQQDLLDAVDRAVPDSYLDPMKDGGDGYEMVQAFAKQGERCSLAVKRFELDGFITSAQGGQLATAFVVFTRPTAAAGAGRVLSGTLVRASAGGQVFRTTIDAVFGTFDLTAHDAVFDAPIVPAVAMGYGYEWNVKGKFVDPQGNTWPGEIDTVDLPLLSPPFFDTTIVVRNDLDVVDPWSGRPPSLDTHGGERNLPRRPGEADYNYQARIRALADTVSPGAIIRQLTAYFKPFGLGWRAVETWQHEYQECFDAPNQPATPYENYDSNLFVYDDPRPASPMQNRWLGEQDYLGAFIVEVQKPPTVSDYGFAYDDTALTEGDLQTAIGIRAVPAYDVPDSLSPPSLEPCYDGFDFGASDIIVNAFALLDEIKAGGVYVVIAIQELS